MAGAISTFRYLRTFNASAALQTQISGGGRRSNVQLGVHQDGLV
jgi:hypothetical protein